MEAKYQADMDRVRISHIDYLATLLTEYESKSGKYPLQSEINSQEILVYVTHRELPTWLTDQAKQLPVEQRSNLALEQDIEKVLQRDIQMPSDPQNVATYAPNVYIYQVSESRACVAGHLYSSTPNTRNVQNRYHKYEICLKS